MFQFYLRTVALAVVLPTITVPNITVPATADAQILRIGPLGGVNVRVPFVSVDVSPFGGTRVRAPFTRVQTPDRGYPYYGYAAPHGHGYVPPPGAYGSPSGYGSPAPDFHSPHFFGFPRDYSRDRDYDRDWNYRRDADYGRDLGMPPVGSGPYLSSPLNSPLSNSLEVPVPERSYRPAVPEIYRPPAPRYHIPSYSEVFPESSGSGDALEGDAPPAHDLPAEIAEYAAADTVGLASRLHDAAERLQRSLDRFAEGEVWSDYLRCSSVQQLAAELARGGSTDAISAPQARSLLANFDGVAANPSLAYVMRLDGFTETRQTLTSLVTAIDGEDRGAPGIINMDPSQFQGEPDFAPRWDAERDDRIPAAEEELPAPRLAPADGSDAPRVFRGEV